MTNCPECDAVITIPGDAVDGEIVTCAECGASFELTKASNGFELKPAQTDFSQETSFSRICYCKKMEFQHQKLQ